MIVNITIRKTTTATPIKPLLQTLRTTPTNMLINRQIGTNRTRQSQRILKNKLQGLNPNAEQNVQADWNVTDTNADAYIKNKPTIPTRTSQLTNNSNFVVDANYTHNPNPFTDALKTKLEQTNVLTDNMVTKINGIVPEPVETVVTDTHLTITNLQGNYVYRCVNPLTNFQIQNVNVGYVPTLFYFTTGDTFVWQFPNTLKSTQYVDFDHNQSYVVAVMNNILTYCELVQ